MTSILEWMTKFSINSRRVQEFKFVSLLKWSAFSISGHINYVFAHNSEKQNEKEFNFNRKNQNFSFLATSLAISVSVVDADAPV